MSDPSSLIDCDFTQGTHTNVLLEGNTGTLTFQSQSPQNTEYPTGSQTLTVTAYSDALKTNSKTITLVINVVCNTALSEWAWGSSVQNLDSVHVRKDYLGEAWDASLTV